MRECDRCHQLLSDDRFVPGNRRCTHCMRRMYAHALSDYVLLMSEEVVELGFGWATARCCDGVPINWLCLHIHPTEADAEACRQESIAAGRGIR